MTGIRYQYSLLPPVIRLLLVSNIVIYIFELINTDFILGTFALWPLSYSGNSSIGSVSGIIQPGFMPWQLISYGFLHGSFTHLFLNMYALWLFGIELENLWGSRKFAQYYIICVIGAGLTQIIATSVSGNYYPTIGASGGVFGILLAFGLFFPNRILILLIPPIPIKAKWFVILYGAIELWFGVTGTEAGVAHFAHLGGMLFGLLFLVYWGNQR